MKFSTLSTALSVASKRTLSQQWNLARSKLLHTRAVMPYRPTTVSFYISSRCNLNCNTCPYHPAAEAPSHTSYVPSPYPDMDLATFSRLARIYRAALNATITAEGEPFLNPAIYAMVTLAAHRHHMTVKTSTNGLKMDEDAARQIAALPLSEINVSLDATDPSTYQTVRGSANYSTVVENVARLVEIRDAARSPLRIRLSHIMAKYNYRCMPDAVKLAAELGVDEILFHSVVGFGNNTLNKPEHCLYDDAETVSFLEDVKAQAPPSLKVSVQPLYNRSGPVPACREPFSSTGVNSRGDVNPCCLLPTDGRWGNAFNGTGWNSPALNAFRATLLRGRLPIPELCPYCPASHPHPHRRIE